MRKAMLVTGILVVLFSGCAENQTNRYSTTGTVEAYRIDIRAAGSGKLIYVNIPEGRQISGDHLLAVVDTTALVLQRKQLKVQLTGFTTQTKSLRNKQAQLQEQLSYLNKQHSRIQQLVKSDGMPQADLDEITTKRNTTQIQLENIPTELTSVSNQRRQLEQQIALINYRIGEQTITAPQKGTILQRYVEKGEQVQTGHLLGTIGLTDTVWVTMYIPETLLGDVKLGEAIEVQPDGSAQTVSGTVEWIASDAEFTPKTVYTEDTRTSLSYAVRVNIPNPVGVFKIGMPVTLSFSITAADES